MARGCQSNAYSLHQKMQEMKLSGNKAPFGKSCDGGFIRWLDVTSEPTLGRRVWSRREMIRHQVRSTWFKNGVWSNLGLFLILLARLSVDMRTKSFIQPLCHVQLSFTADTERISLQGTEYIQCGAIYC